MTTRRLAAILAADVVGFSPMMEKDEEGTLRRIKALQREVIEPKVRDRSDSLRSEDLREAWRRSGRSVRRSSGRADGRAPVPIIVGPSPR